MKKILSIALVLLFVASLIMAMGVSVAATTPEEDAGIVGYIEDVPVVVLVVVGVLACLLCIWLVVLVIAIFVFPFRVIFGFKVKDKKKRRKFKKSKKAKNEDDAKNGLTLSPEETKKVLVIGGCVVATSLLLGALMSARRK